MTTLTTGVVTVSVYSDGRTRLVDRLDDRVTDLAPGTPQGLRARVLATLASGQWLDDDGARGAAFALLRECSAAASQ